MELKIGAVTMRNLNIIEIHREPGEGMVIDIIKYEDDKKLKGFLVLDKQETNAFINALKKD